MMVYSANNYRQPDYSKVLLLPCISWLQSAAAHLQAPERQIGYCCEGCALQDLQIPDEPPKM